MVGLIPKWVTSLITLYIFLKLFCILSLQIEEKEKILNGECYEFFKKSLQ